VRRLLFLVCAALLTTVSAHAQTTPQSVDARALAQEAKTAFDAGDFATAARLLDQAYQAKPWPVFLYNLGRTHQQAGNKLEAVRAYERYLAAEPSSPDAGLVRESIRQLREQIDHDRALEQQALSAKQRAAQGALEAQLSKEAMERAQRDATERARHRPSAWPWVVTGAGVGGVTAGVVLGLLSRSAHGSAVSDVSAAQAQSDQSHAQSLAVAANVLFVAGAAVGVAGAVWGVFDLRLALGHDAHVSLLPGALVARGAF
jgi:tetratricopeptide (TPR) repeat protein